MGDKLEKRVAVVSMARDAEFFVNKWVDYYGKLFGEGNLYLIIDGYDNKYPKVEDKINVIRMPHIKMGRSEGDKNRSRMVSTFARALFFRYDVVIAHDIDEYVVLDPSEGENIKDFINKPSRYPAVSALGIDVGQHLDLETPMDASKPFLMQRSFAELSSRYTKPVIAYKPITWGSGFHRVKGRNFHIASNLFLFHFGMADANTSRSKLEDSVRLSEGWGNHLSRRNALFYKILSGFAINGDKIFKRTRFMQSILRPIYAWNKPGSIGSGDIIKIPERFSSII